MINVKNLIKIIVVGTIAISGVQMLLLEISEPQQSAESKQKMEEIDQLLERGDRLIEEVNRQVEEAEKK
ncbi:MAG: hypothetical protein KME43_07550 [Myxacorys chilensis ATA2-1-KO14]|jgi:hypothetical protein|nr:hypothetical protein [Myxacorys chilensis ATA2-1-KO14]